MEEYIIQWETGHKLYFIAQILSRIIVTNIN